MALSNYPSNVPRRSVDFQLNRSYVSLPPSYWNFISETSCTGTATVFEFFNLLFFMRNKICNFSRDLIKTEKLLSLELADEIVFLPWRIFLYLDRLAIVDIYVASIRLSFRWFERNYLERQMTVILFIDTNGNLGIGNCILIAANVLLYRNIIQWQMKEK